MDIYDPEILESLSPEEQLRYQGQLIENYKLEICRRDINAFLEYVLEDEETGEPIVQAPMHKAWHKLCDEQNKIIMLAFPESGKALPLDTPIPTPTGWKTMGQLKVGDLVFDSKGKPCRVTFATEIQSGRDVYKVKFDDNDEILADADHQWIVTDKNIHERNRVTNSSISKKYSGDGEKCLCGCGLRAKKGKKRIFGHHNRKNGIWRVVTTKQMLEAGVMVDSGAKKKNGAPYLQSRWRIPLCGSVEYPEVKLPVHPYVLGAWLGDGNSAMPYLTFHKDDRFIYDRCKELEGGDCEPKPEKKNPNVWRGNIGGFRPKGRKKNSPCLSNKLLELGVLNNKHIPEIYLTSSVSQRKELLAGLLDTDGYLSKKAGNCSQVEFSSSIEKLSSGVLELARSLGFKARMKSSPSTLYGRVVGMRHRVFFTVREPVFKLPRKLQRQELESFNSRAHSRYVRSIEPVKSVPVRCIQVDSPDESYLAGRSYTVTHNTQNLMIGRTLFELGGDSSLRFLILSKNDDSATKIAKSIAHYINTSERLHKVFPDLKLAGKSDGSGGVFTVVRSVMSKDPSVQSVGISGTWQGSRVDRLLVDDVLDYDNTRTSSQREDIYRRFKSKALSRLTRRGRTLVVGNVFDPDDLYHRLAREWGEKCAFRYPVLEDDGLISRWPEKWPLARINEKRTLLGPLEFARQMLCIPRDDTTARFKRAWIDIALERGKDLEVTHALRGIPSGCSVWTGVDLAVQRGDENDWTLFFTMLLHQNKDKEILEIWRGKWTGPEIVQNCIDVHNRFGSILIVENNAAQDFICQFAGTHGIPVIGFTTGKGKADPTFGVESIAAEMAAGKWIIPSKGERLHPEIERFVNEMLFYSPSAHTGDALMAAYFAKEGARLRLGVPLKGEIGRLNIRAR